MRVLGISFRGRGVAFEGLGPQRMPSGTQGYSKDQDGDMSVTRVYVEGPFDARTPDDTPSRHSKKPLMAPTNMATSTGTNHDNHTGKPFVTIVPARIASTPTSDPIEISIFPEIIRMDMPTAATAR